MTGLTNCKKTSRHHSQLLLCVKVRKTNDAKSTKWSKTSILAIFDDFKVKYPQIANCPEK